MVPNTVRLRMKMGHHIKLFAPKANSSEKSSLAGLWLRWVLLA